MPLRPIFRENLADVIIDSCWLYSPEISDSIVSSRVKLYSREIWMKSQSTGEKEPLASKVTFGNYPTLTFGQTSSRNDNHLSGNRERRPIGIIRLPE